MNAFSSNSLQFNFNNHFLSSFLSLMCIEPEKVETFLRKTGNEFLDENFGKGEGKTFIVSNEDEEE